MKSYIITMLGVLHLNIPEGTIITPRHIAGVQVRYWSLINDAI